MFALVGELSFSRDDYVCSLLMIMFSLCDDGFDFNDFSSFGGVIFLTIYKHELDEEPLHSWCVLISWTIDS